MEFDHIANDDFGPGVIIRKVPQTYRVRASARF